jgi:hypothetical protein
MRHAATDARCHTSVRRDAALPMLTPATAVLLLPYYYDAYADAIIFSPLRHYWLLMPLITPLPLRLSPLLALTPFCR